MIKAKPLRLANYVTFPHHGAAVILPAEKGRQPLRITSRVPCRKVYRLRMIYFKRPGFSIAEPILSGDDLLNYAKPLGKIIAALLCKKGMNGGAWLGMSNKCSRVSEV